MLCDVCDCASCCCFLSLDDKPVVLRFLLPITNKRQSLLLYFFYSINHIKKRIAYWQAWNLFRHIRLNIDSRHRCLNHHRYSLLRRRLHRNWHRHKQLYNHTRLLLHIHLDLPSKQKKTQRYTQKHINHRKELGLCFAFFFLSLHC